MPFLLLKKPFKRLSFTCLVRTPPTRHFFMFVIQFLFTSLKLIKIWLILSLFFLLFLVSEFPSASAGARRVPGLSSWSEFLVRVPGLSSWSEFLVRVPGPSSWSGRTGTLKQDTVVTQVNHGPKLADLGRGTDGIKDF